MTLTFRAIVGEIVLAMEKKRWEILNILECYATLKGRELFR